MTSYVNFTTLATALETWDHVGHSHENMERDFGVIALERLFELQPKAKVVFGCTADPDDKVIDAWVDIHAKAFWRLFDSALLLLGSDPEILEEMLKQVGLRHKHMGVDPCILPDMGEALIYAIEQLLERPLTGDQRDAWDDVYEVVSAEMAKHMLI